MTGQGKWLPEFTSDSWLSLRCMAVVSVVDWASTGRTLKGSASRNLKKGGTLAPGVASASGVILRPIFSVQVIGNKALKLPLLPLQVIVSAHLHANRHFSRSRERPESLRLTRPCASHAALEGMVEAMGSTITYTNTA